MTPAVRATHLTHRYPDGRLALDGVSFALAPGERAAVVGPNGAGKTTLFLRLCGVLTGTPGQVIVNGLDAAHTSHRKQFPKHVGVLFQNPDDQLFAGTVLDDVAFGPLNLGMSIGEAQAAATAALNRVGLTGCDDRSPQRLSGGEKRRAALAGVLAMTPGVLLLDEPSMFLDPRGRRELIRTISELPGTLLVATHDLDLVLDTCPRAIILDAGRIAADGPTKELFADPALMDAHGLDVPHRLRK